MPAPPSKVKEYLLEILGSGEPFKRDELVSRAKGLAQSNGFRLDASAAIPNVKKALRSLANDGKIESPRVGWWRIANPDLPQPVQFDAGEPQSEPEEAEPQPEQRIVINREIGDGPESVYVYYHEAYAELAQLKGASEWECKVGWTVGEPDSRVIGQGALTAFPAPPIMGLVIRTENGRALERAIHTALTLAGRRVERNGGTEWFITSPIRIEQWVSAFSGSLKILLSHDQNMGRSLCKDANENFAAK